MILHEANKADKENQSCNRYKNYQHTQQLKVLQCDSNPRKERSYRMQQQVSKLEEP